MDSFAEIELRHLRYFATIARSGTITEAARRLHISQPSLTQQLKSLEGRVGTRLFDRTPRGLRLTASGQILLSSVNRATDELRIGLAHARQRPLSVRIGMCRGVTQSALARSEKILDACGPVDKTYEAVDTRRQPELLRNGHLDIGLLRVPVDDRGLSAHIVSDEPLGVVVSNGSPLAAHPQLNWSDLAEVSLLWFSTARAPDFAATVLAHLRANGWAPPLVVAEHGHSLFRHALITTPDLVALRPAEVIANDTELVWRAITPNPPRETLALCVRADTSWDRLLRKSPG